MPKPTVLEAAQEALTTVLQHIAKVEQQGRGNSPEALELRAFYLVLSWTTGLGPDAEAFSRKLDQMRAL